jgi:hypothetical protein
LIYQLGQGNRERLSDGNEHSLRQAPRNKSTQIIVTLLFKNNNSFCGRKSNFGSGGLSLTAQQRQA